MGASQSNDLDGSPERPSCCLTSIVATCRPISPPVLAAGHALVEAPAYSGQSASGA